MVADENLDVELLRTVTRLVFLRRENIGGKKIGGTAGPAGWISRPRNLREIVIGRGTKSSFRLV